MLSIKVNAEGVLDKLSELEQRQIPFAFATALNRTAEEIQIAVRDEIKKTFTIRSPWVLSNVRIRNADRATKTQSSVTIEITPDSVLTKFEVGGTKTARDGGNVALPLLAGRTKRDLIKRSERPRAFNLVNTSGAASNVIARGQRNTILIRSKGGRQLLLQRVAKRSKFYGKGKGRDPNLKLLWVMVKRAQIPASLKFYQTATGVAGERFAINMKGMLAMALRTAR